MALRGRSYRRLRFLGAILAFAAVCAAAGFGLTAAFGVVVMPIVAVAATLGGIVVGHLAAVRWLL